MEECCLIKSMKMSHLTQVRELMEELKIKVIEIEGNAACFTSEFKTERWSYDVITPSAARSLFSGIYWKPAIKWNVKKIEVLNPIVRANESSRERVKKPTKNGDDGFKTTLKNTNYLLNVRYRLYAEMEFIPIEEREEVKRDILNNPKVKDKEAALAEYKSKHPDECLEKHLAIFDRRASRGESKKALYLGKSKYPCNFKFITDLSNLDKPISEDRNFGRMLFDKEYEDGLVLNNVFFDCVMRQGVINLPSWEKLLAEHKKKKEVS